MMGCLFLFSCPAWTRTRDYSINSRVFYQLNYGTITRFICTILTQKESLKELLLESHSGRDGIRTHDPLNANQMLSQLSYKPML